jgi:hypothetical protein
MGLYFSAVQLARIHHLLVDLIKAKPQGEKFEFPLPALHILRVKRKSHIV